SLPGLSRHTAHLVVCGAILVGAASSTSIAQDRPASRAERLELSGDLELSRLVELVSERVGASVQYDAQQLRQKITLRLRDPVDDRDLWRILVSTLESQGFAMIETEQPGLFRVAQIQGAAGFIPRLSMPGEGLDEAARSSFV